MKKLAIVLLSFLISLLPVFAQDCESFGVLEEGNSWEMTNYNKKDKVEGIITYSVIKKYEENGSVVWDMKMVTTDDKGKDPYEVEYTMTCKANIFKIDADAFINGQMKESLAGMEGMEVEMDASETEFPNSLEVGDELQDSKVTIKASMNGFSVMNMTSITKDRKVTGEEKITTEAGEFDTFKIEETNVIESKLMNSETKSVTYFVPGFWMVKSEYYDKKGNLEGYSLLTKMDEK